MSKEEAKSSSASNQSNAPSGPSINTSYLRTNATNFSLAPKGQEVDIEFGKCNFYTDRKPNTSAKYVVNTYSVGTLEATIAKMVTPHGSNISELRGPGVSVHYIINTDGTIYQLVPESKRPWATGVGNLQHKSKLNPAIENIQNDMNSFGISVMYINNGKSSLTPAQIEAGIMLTRDIVVRNQIDQEKVIGFADWTPGRHIAPGPYFPWEAFANKGKLGLWSDIERKKDPKILVSYKDKPVPEEIDHIEQALAELTKKYSASTQAGKVVQEYSTNFPGFKASFSGAMHTALDKAKTGLSKLGMVGVPSGKDTSVFLDSATLSSMLCFNLHHLGPQIIANDALRDLYDSRLWVDSSDPDARGILGAWTTNSQAVLDDLLGGS